MIIYRIKPIIRFNIKKYIVEQQKNFLWWKVWEPIRETTKDSNIAFFSSREEAQIFLNELKEADNGGTN